MSVESAALVISVSRDAKHRFAKPTTDEITLLEGLGVEGGTHTGRTVQHRSRVAADPTQPNLRQVHLIHSELFEGAAADGFSVSPGQMGENMSLLTLPWVKSVREALVEGLLPRDN
ncbi:MAG: hypothetical protein ACYCZY_07700 [Lacisediminihabitans sp.]